MPTEHGIREIIAKLGQAAKLSSPLGPHDLRHTVAKSLLDPAAYGLDGPPMPLPAIQQLLGHADIATLTLQAYSNKRSDHQEESKIVWSGTREQAWENFYANISVFTGCR
jgi:site-specific recombinase XerD